MIRDDIVLLIEKAIKKAQKKGDLPPFDLPEVTVDHPKDSTRGDYASPVCMSMARLARMAPVQIAEKVLARMDRPDYVGAVEVAHPGFINISLAPAWVAAQVETVVDEKEHYGHVNLGRGRRAQVEYISANPTGPLTFGSGRNAVLGDTLANVLAAAGWQVQREFYVNDTGNQVALVAASLYARYAQARGRDEPLPENGYPGAYLIEMGQAIAAAAGDRFLAMDRDEALAALQAEGV